ncbi:MAG TPA: hypothetical protein VF576_02930 [Rubricoccaceae bacterium]|jgi:hypothetical protein
MTQRTARKIADLWLCSVAEQAESRVHFDGLLSTEDADKVEAALRRKADQIRERHDAYVHLQTSEQIVAAALP